MTDRPTNHPTNGRDSGFKESYTFKKGKGIGTIVLIFCIKNLSSQDGISIGEISGLKIQNCPVPEESLADFVQLRLGVPLKQVGEVEDRLPF